MPPRLISKAQPKAKVTRDTRPEGMSVEEWKVIRRRERMEERRAKRRPLNSIAYKIRVNDERRREREKPVPAPTVRERPKEPYARKYSYEDMVAVIKYMADHSITLSRACVLHDINPTSVFAYMSRHDELKRLYIAAREAYVHYQVDRLDEIAKNEFDVTRARLRVDVAKWEAAKVLPRVYGDSLKITGDPNNPLAVQRVVDANALKTLTTEELDAALVAAEKLVGPES